MVCTVEKVFPTILVTYLMERQKLIQELTYSALDRPNVVSIGIQGCCPVWNEGSDLEPE